MPTLFDLDHPIETAAVVVLPTPWQATTSYRRGTAGAPQAVLLASLQVDLEHRLTGQAWRQGFAMAPPPPVDWDALAEQDALEVIRAGGGLPERAARVDALAQELRAWVKQQARAVLDRGAIPAVLGGDHSCPLGLMEAVGEGGPFGVLQIDAHADLRVAYQGFEFSHASISHNALAVVPQLQTLVQLGVRDYCREEARVMERDPRVHTFFDADLAWERAQGTPWMEQLQRVLAPLPQRVYLSVDIDGLEPSLCPNTGTPVPGGLSWHQLTTLLRALIESKREILGFDLCEVGPGEWDAIVGARVLFELGCAAIHSRGHHGA